MMGYRIHYGETVIKETFAQPKPKENFPVKVILSLTLCCAVLFTLLRNVDSVINFLLPGNQQTTKAAISTFVQDLNEGEPIKDAVTAFCREIIENANIPD